MCYEKGAAVGLLLLMVFWAAGCNSNVGKDKEPEKKSIRSVTANPLPSWNEGALKESIIAYVKAVSDTSSNEFIPAVDRIATFDNDGTLWQSEQYHYDQGVWYVQSGGGYTVVQAPVGGTVTTIPSGSTTTVVNNVTNYYYGGAYYEKSGTTYKVVPPPAGAVVENLPEGGEEVKIGDQTYVKIGETYYQPVQVDGKNKYEVVQVETDK